MATRETGEESAVLRAVAEARSAYDRAVAAAERRRLVLADRMADAASAGEQISRIARRAGYEQAYVRRVVRERGVAPKQPKRIPPPGFRREDVD